MGLKTDRELRKFIPESPRELWRGKIVEVNGSETVSGNPLFCWVRPDGGGQPLAIYNDAVLHKKGRRVVVGSDRIDKRIRVLRGIYISGTTQVVNFNVGPHGSSHGPDGDDVAYIDAWQILNLRVYPTTGMNVHFNGGYVPYRGKPIWAPADDLDLTSSIPGSGARYSLIRVSSIGVLSVQDGTPVDSFADLSDDDIPECEVGYAMMATVRLYYGQTALSNLVSDPDVRMVIWGSGLFREEVGGEIALDDLTDVEITDLGDDEIIVSDTDVFVNKTFTEAGVSEVGHEHVVEDITDLTQIVDDRYLWTPGIYTAVYFDETDESFHALLSDDGLDWDDLGFGFGDTVRDPSILFHGGKWWVAYTHVDSPYDLIPIRSSEDLIAWSAVVEIDTSELGGTGVAWAPEWFVDDDGSVHLFMACGGSSTHKIYETHPTNAAWTTWSNLIEVTGTGFPTDMIDAFVIKLGNTYYLWYKDDITDYLCYATSTSLTSGYTEIKDGDWAGFGSNREGECLTLINPYLWRIYYNTTLTNGVYYAESDDNFATWSTPASVSDLGSLSHGTVIHVRDFVAFKSIKDVLGYIPDITIEEDIGTAKIGCTLYRSTAQSISNSTETPMVWDTEHRDDGGCWAAGDPTKIYAPVDGWYAASFYGDWAAYTGLGRRAYIQINGGSYNFARFGAPAPSDYNNPTNNPSGLFYLTAGDYIQVILWQNSGTSVSMGAWAMVGFVRVGGSSHEIQDGGTPVDTHSKINFVGFDITEDEENDAIVIEGGGAALTVTEEDNSPSVADVVEIRVPNGTLTDNGGGSVSLTYTSSDEDAIHDNVSGEIHAITEETSPDNSDELVLESSANSYAKRRVKISNLFGGGGGGAVVVKRVATQFDKTNTTLEKVTELTTAVEAGKTYMFRALLHLYLDVDGGYKIAVGGSCTATSIMWEMVGIDYDGEDIEYSGRFNVLGSSGTSYGIVGVELKIDGLIVVDAAGDLEVQFAQAVADGTSSVLVDSYLIITEVGTNVEDTDAIHDDVAGEIHAVTEETSPASSDELLLESAVNSYAKRRMAIASLLSSANNILQNQVFN